ncbi:hypothetical protein Ait01nite_025820 [Actinoplanes italicus]|uniref:Uncharacterized protein n=1 Tax=Actinoplanes italicus TaxID=113567 RepID=A0A2T0KF98_9ACTN|nr:hypothetical protein [Actinoplanes italicus]PRX22045.1 hypothetical protein CLV67_105222 [Actinoplanes italicus]GIE29537.1 hypothetical protein Ait01nite_025820 [Actinoplanes italicus]
MTSDLITLIPVAAGLVTTLLARSLVAWVEVRGRIRSLRIALRGTDPEQRAEIIRALRERP